MLLEDNSYGAPCSECALTPLRAYIYRMILPRQESLVNEYGRSPYEQFRKAGVSYFVAKSIFEITKKTNFENRTCSLTLYSIYTRFNT
jgi:hypothetical protein